MNQDLNLWQFIARRLRKQEPVMLLLVAESSGSSPGRQGFKMAVGLDGALCGSIGGGIMEFKLVELAKARLTASEPETLVKKQFHHKAAPQFQSGMICSGEQTVLLLPLQQQYLKAIQTLIRCLKTHEPAILSISKALEKQTLQVLEAQNNERPYRFEESKESGYLFEENVGFKNRLFIVGAGHCALALSKIMAQLDFYCCLLDDRPGLSTFEQNKFVQEKQIIESYTNIGDRIPAGSNVYVVVMTLGYRSDELVLRQLMDKKLKYLGMLGSAAKVATLLEELRAEFPQAGNLNKIQAPIGLNINSRTPEEIAVSIAAEIIAVKNSID